RLPAFSIAQMWPADPFALGDRVPEVVHSVRRRGQRIRLALVARFVVSHEERVRLELERLFSLRNKPRRACGSVLVFTRQRQIARREVKSIGRSKLQQVESLGLTVDARW